MDMIMEKLKLTNPDGSRIDFNDISMESLGSHVLFGAVDETSMKEAVTFILKANQLFQGEDDISLYLNCIGGTCYDGFALIDIMDVSRIPVRTVGMGNIMSMGVLILAAGAKGKRVITKNTQVMAHQFYGGTEGKFHELVTAHRAELYLEQQFMHHFLRNTKMNEKQIRDIVFGASDNWLSPSECKKYGIVDHVIDELPQFKIDPLRPSRASGSRRQAR
jgi:ATP-dependent Clp protease protease subunit